MPPRRRHHGATENLVRVWSICGAIGADARPNWNERAPPIGGHLKPNVRFTPPKADIWDGGAEMKKKSLLHYELYDSSARGDKIGYWRWPVFAGREKPLSVGSFYGT